MLVLVVDLLVLVVLVRHPEIFVRYPSTKAGFDAVERDESEGLWTGISL